MSLPDLVQSLVQAFPRQPVPDATVRLYVQDLADLPEPLVAEAIVELRRTSQWFPSISEIRASAAEKMLGLPSEPEALREVESAVFWRPEFKPCPPCDGRGFVDEDLDSVCAACRGSGETLANSRPLLNPVVADALAIVGGPEAFRETDSPEVIRGQFLRLYKTLRGRSLHETQATGLPPAPVLPALPAGSRAV